MVGGMDRNYPKSAAEFRRAARYTGILVDHDHDHTQYLEADDGTHRPHVGDAIALFDELRECF